MTTESIGGGALGMDDGDFWTSPASAPSGSDDLGSSLTLEDPPAEGLTLAGPSRVPLETRSTLPLVSQRVTTTTLSAREPFERLAVLTAVDVDRNELFTGMAVEVDNPAAFQVPPDGGEPLLVTEREVHEARERIGIPWRPATLLVTVLLRDKTSNRARVSLAHSGDTFKDPEVEKFLETKRGQLGAKPPWPAAGVPLPSYGKLGGSPPIPEKPGIAISVERVLLRRGSALPRAIVHGSFRLPAFAEDRVPPRVEESDVAARPTATIGIHLVVMGSEDPVPRRVPLRIPSWDVLPDGEQAPLVTGYFAFDLGQIVGLGTRPQTFFLYFFSRELLVGPALTAIVTEDMLPPGAM